MAEEKRFTREELARHDGVAEPTVYVAYKGVVYDVTASPLWKTGTHMRRHAAGRDLTVEFSAAPHGEEMFGRVERVGVLAGDASEDEGRDEGGPGGSERDASLDHLPEGLRVMLEKYPVLRHPVHPMVVHLPVASALLVPFFDLAYLATGRKGFEETGFYLDVVALLTAPAAIASGAYSWWVDYRAGRMTAIRIKIPTAVVYTAVAAAIAAWRAADPDVLDRGDNEDGNGGGGRGGSGKRRAYLALSMSLPACATVLGYFGGKLTYPR